MAESLPTMTTDHTVTAKTSGMGGRMKINTTGHILETDTGEAHHHAPDTRHLLRMVKHNWDTHTAQSAPLLILGLGRSAQELT